MFLSKNVIMDTFHCQKWLLLLIFAVYRRLDPVDGLKCFCNGDNLGCPNSTCVTDGYCFASASVVGNGEKKYSYQGVFLSCMSLRQALPPENPMRCLKPTVLCCKSELCNTQENLSKVLQASAMDVGTEKRYSLLGTGLYGVVRTKGLTYIAALRTSVTVTSFQVRNTFGMCRHVRASSLGSFIVMSTSHVLLKFHDKITKWYLLKG